jgi:hypothetical protein
MLRVLAKNDWAFTEEELENKIPLLLIKNTCPLE